MGDLVPPDYLLKAKEFERVFVQKEGFGNLRQQAVDGQLGELCNRLTCWRVFLGLFPETGSLQDWTEAVTAYRSEYSQLCEELQSVPTSDQDLTINNPLSSAQSNPWNSFHQDNELKERIRMDVERTYQERPLFQHEEIQNMLTRILLLWAKKHPELGYKQGMNELLAIVMFIAFCEHCPREVEISEEAEASLRVLNDPLSLEADVFTLFNKIMTLGVSDLFNPVLKTAQRPAKNLFTWDHEADKNQLVNQDKSQEAGVSLVLRRCHRIHHRFLQAIDLELYRHLETEAVEPQMYLQRWLRCLLSRELTLAHTLVVWDAMFAALGLGIENRNEALTGPLNASAEVVLLDFICVAMLVFVRRFCEI